MGLTDKGISLASGFKYQAGRPLDVRTTVENTVERDELVSSNAAYLGMRVYVKSVDKSYYYTASGWKEVPIGAMYTHPSTHPATMITEDTNHRFMTDAERDKLQSLLPAVALTRAEYEALEKSGSIDKNTIYYITDDFENMHIIDDDTSSIGTTYSSSKIDELIKNGSVMVATKATQDSAGQQINTTYIKGLSVSGRTITYTKGDGTTGTITTQDTTYGIASTSANGLMSSSDKSKLDGIAANANNYSHPETHSLDMITETTDLKVMTAAERTKLAGIEAGANKYVHPSTHPATMITEDATHRFMTDAERDKLQSQLPAVALTRAEYEALKEAGNIDENTIYYITDDFENIHIIDDDTSSIGTTYSSSKIDELIANGSVATSTKATQDSAGQKITTTYIKGLSVSGKTITYTKGDGSTGTIITQDTTYSTGTASTLGLTKLYTGTGTATDGTMTQKAITDALSGKANSSHTHNYAGSSSVGGAANSVANAIAIKLNGGTTEGTNLFTFNGSAAKTINITPSAIGAAASSHGTHVTYSTDAPKANGTAAAGSSSAVARADHVHPLQTTISGNAATATKATQDSAGQQINTTYIKGLSVSGKVITYTKGDGTTGTITTQDTNTTYSAFKGATSSAAGSAGLVPAPASGAQDKFLKADGTWATPTTIPGNAETATKATQDSAGQQITSTYIKDLSVSGKVITYTKGDGTTGTITTQDTNTTYSTGTTTYSGTTKLYTGTGSATDGTMTQKAITDALGGKAASSHTHTKSQITDFPTSLPASDVYSWAKASTKPSYAWSEITGKPSTFTPSSHTHNYAGSSSVGGAANSVANAIAIKLNGGTTEGTNLFTFNGSAAKTINITPSSIGAAASSHGTHVSYSTDAPKANGTASAGSSGAVARADHVHPLQTNISGNAATATALTSNAGSSTQPVYFSGGKPVACSYTLGKSVPSNAVFTDTDTWRGIQNNLTSDSTTDSLSAAQGKVLKGLVDGKAASSHTHNYAGSSSAGGAANSVANALTISLNGTSQGAYNGSSAKSINVTPSAIGASAKSSKVTATLAASSWSGSAAPYSITVSVSGVTTSNNVEVVLPGSATTAQAQAWMEAGVAHGTQASGSVTLKAYGTKPSINIPMEFIVRGDI